MRVHVQAFRVDIQSASRDFLGSKVSDSKEICTKNIVSLKNDGQMKFKFYIDLNGNGA